MEEGMKRFTSFLCSIYIIIFLAITGIYEVVPSGSHDLYGPHPTHGTMMLFAVVAFVFILINEFGRGT
jgi:hypothetical protein